MKVTFTQKCKYSEDGAHVKTKQAGETCELRDDLAEKFCSYGWCKPYQSAPQKQSKSKKKAEENKAFTAAPENKSKSAAPENKSGE